MKRKIGIISVVTVIVASLAIIANAQTIQLFNGTIASTANATVPPAFAAATSAQTKKFIDFDGDGFIFGPTPTIIPSNYYASLGVTLLNLDARNVGSNPWTHSPSVGAWHTGFSSAITTPYSFIFDQPIASFGMFANGLEDTLTIKVYSNSGTLAFTINPSGEATNSQFHGLVGKGNMIQRLDFICNDYHITALSEKSSVG
jgi:hypothetical protein